MTLKWKTITTRASTSNLKRSNNLHKILKRKRKMPQNSQREVVVNLLLRGKEARLRLSQLLSRRNNPQLLKSRKKLNQRRRKRMQRPKLGIS
jgi:hypothetical protein